MRGGPALYSHPLYLRTIVTSACLSLSASGHDPSPLTRVVLLLCPGVTGDCCRPGHRRVPALPPGRLPLRVLRRVPQVVRPHPPRLGAHCLDGLVRQGGLVAMHAPSAARVEQRAEGVIGRRSGWEGLWGREGDEGSCRREGRRRRAQRRQRGRRADSMRESGEGEGGITV